MVIYLTACCLLVVWNLTHPLGSSNYSTPKLLTYHAPEYDRDIAEAPPPPTEGVSGNSRLTIQNCHVPTGVNYSFNH